MAVNILPRTVLGGSTVGPAVHEDVTIRSGRKSCRFVQAKIFVVAN